MIDRLRAEIASLIAREKELKNTIANYDLIYRKEI